MAVSKLLTLTLTLTLALTLTLWGENGVAYECTDQELSNGV